MGAIGGMFPPAIMIFKTPSIRGKHVPNATYVTSPGSLRYFPRGMTAR